MTEEYALIRAAKYLGVAPWELLERPLFWQQKALLYERVDDHVQHELQRRANDAASVTS